MQTYLPLIQALLAEWYTFTLNNALYAAALATTVWLLTAMLYSIRISAIKRSLVASEKAANESLSDLQQQLKLSQEELSGTNLQMEKASAAAQDETQRALGLEQLIYQRNKQIAEIIQSLATHFDLGERPLLASEDVKADLLWQQHAKVISQLIERLRTEQQEKLKLQQTCQAETAKLAEKEVLLEMLQSTLDTHAEQLSKLELALKEQKTLLQQQDTAQQALSNTLKNYQPTVIRPSEPEPTTSSWQHPLPLETSPAAKEAIPMQEVQPEPHAAASWSEEAIITPVLPTIKPQSIPEEAPYASLDLEQQPVIPAKGSFGKIKNLFGTAKQAPIKTEPQWAVTQADEPLTATIEQPEDEVPEKTEKTSGKLKGFYNKFRSKDK